MDSKIEELAKVIAERAESEADKARDADGDRSHCCRSYLKLRDMALEMLLVISSYRRTHMEKYEDAPTPTLTDAELRCIDQAIRDCEYGMHREPESGGYYLRDMVTLRALRQRLG
jgi:hypothetical protein